MLAASVLASQQHSLYCTFTFQCSHACNLEEAYRVQCSMRAACTRRYLFRVRVFTQKPLAESTKFTYFFYNEVTGDVQVLGPVQLTVEGFAT